MDGFDKLDLDILRLIVEEPRAGVREYSRRLNIARNTAQARITKLEKAGVIVTWRPQINLAPLATPSWRSCTSTSPRAKSTKPWNG